MNKGKVEIDAKEVIKMLVNLQPTLRKRAYRNGIRKSLNITKKETIKNLRARVGKDVARRKNARTRKSLEQGVLTKVYKDVSGGAIHIMRNFILRFLENGTDERFIETWRGKPLKKKRPTGRIKALHFFRDAVNSTEKQVFNTLEQNIADAIRKINNKQL